MLSLWMPFTIPPSFPITDLWLLLASPSLPMPGAAVSERDSGDECDCDDCQ